MTKERMFEIYEKTACMDFVLACGFYQGNAVAVKLTFAEMRKTLTDKAFSVQKTSGKEKRSGIAKIRCELTKNRIELLAKVGKVVIICTETEFAEKLAEMKAIKSGYGVGETFENLLYSMVGQTWKKDNRPFYESPDLTYKGIRYQIKSAKFSLPHEEILQEIAEKFNI